jgi:hypothetical protein
LLKISPKKIEKIKISTIGEFELSATAFSTLNLQSSKIALVIPQPQHSILNKYLKTQ